MHACVSLACTLDGSGPLYFISCSHQISSRPFESCAALFAVCIGHTHRRVDTRKRYRPCRPIVHCTQTCTRACVHEFLHTKHARAHVCVCMHLYVGAALPGMSKSVHLSVWARHCVRACAHAITLRESHLIDEQWQVPVALDPLSEHVVHDRLTGGAHLQGRRRTPTCACTESSAHSRMLTAGTLENKWCLGFCVCQ